LGSAGDCRAIIIKKDWTFEVLFEDHKPTIDAEKKRIKDAGLIVQNGRVIGELAVSRSIGDFKYKGDPIEHCLQAVTCVPTTRTLQRQESDLMLLLMSDGIVDGITMEELVQTFQGGEYSTQLKEVVKKCLEPGKSSDNMTLLAIPL
jgi:serine/threonine protein phosphatase PrpC